MELHYTYIHLQLTPYMRIEKINSDLQVDRWILGFSCYLKNLQLYKECQWIGGFFGFRCYLENLQFYKESRYIYSQFQLNKQNLYFLTGGL